MVAAMSRNWWAIALRGLLAVLFGIVAFIWPGLTVQVLVILVGAISVVAGVVFLVWPGISALALLYLVAAWAILTGVARIVAAIQLRRTIHNEWLLVASGVASLLFGVIAAIFPGAGILALIWFVAAWAIILGVLLIALALSMRQLGPGLSAAG